MNIKDMLINAYGRGYNDGQNASNAYSNPSDAERCANDILAEQHQGEPVAYSADPFGNPSLDPKKA